MLRAKTESASGRRDVARAQREDWDVDSRDVNLPRAAPTARNLDAADDAEFAHLVLDVAENVL